MITLGKKGDLHSRRQALAFLRTDNAVKRLFDVVSPRYGDRNGGYLRIVRAGFQQSRACPGPRLCAETSRPPPRCRQLGGRAARGR